VDLKGGRDSWSKFLSNELHILHSSEKILG
jgi:hypothetical protein